MARQARRKSSTGLYHVMMRGADRRILFADDQDNLGFLLSLKRAKKASGFKLYAYCLMGNHVHLLIKEEEEPLEIVIKRLGVSYVYHYNEKYDLLGHLFQDRYRSEPVETTAYFLDVLRYICQNPVKAGLSRNPMEYRWLGCAGVKDEFALTDDISYYTDLSGNELLTFVNGNCEEDHLEESYRRRMTDRDAISKLCKVCECEHVQEIEGWPKQRRDEAIKKALKAGLSIRQISRLTGISKAVIEWVKQGGRNYENCNHFLFRASWKHPETAECHRGKERRYPD